MARELWITNATIATQDDERRVIEKGSVRVVDGRIAEIRAQGRGPGRISPRAQKVDAAGLTLLPGFVQTHVHLCQTLFRNMADDLELLDWLSERIWPMEAAHTAETLETSALLGIHELLSSGTTCILDMATVRHTEAVFKAVEKSGIRANVGKCLMDHPETTPEGLRESTESALREARALFKKWHGKRNDRIRVSFAPRFVLSCTEKLLREVETLARTEGAIIHTHASENLKEIQRVKELVRCENIEYLHQLGLTSPRLVLAHCIWLRPSEMEILRKTGTHVAHCPSSNLKLASGLARVPEMLQRGINVSLGADGAPCNNNLNIFQEMRLAALIHKPANGPRTMRAQEVLDMATRHGARALGWDADIGSIEVGKRADLVLLDLERPESQLAPLGKSPRALGEAIASSVVYSAQPAHVRQTWVDGVSVYARGRVLKIPADRIARDAGRARRTILRRLKKTL